MTTIRSYAETLYGSRTKVKIVFLFFYTTGGRRGEGIKKKTNTELHNNDNKNNNKNDKMNKLINVQIINNY